MIGNGSATTSDEPATVYDDDDDFSRPLLGFSRSHVGPLPPPEMLAQYGETPGAAELVLGMAEKEQEHRHNMQRRELEVAAQDVSSQALDRQGEQALARRGQAIGAVVCVLVLLAGMTASVLIAIYAPGQQWLSALSTLVPVVGLTGLVFTLMRGRHTREQKAKDQPEALEGSD